MGMSRKVGTLQKMTEAALKSQHGVKWSHVLHYLESHCETDTDPDDIFKLPFRSPLPIHYMPTEELRRELWYDSKTGQSVLRTALPGAPSRIIAALCHLGPEAMGAVDEKGRLPLHYACERPVTPDSETILMIFLKSNPGAVLHRDTDGGRTPLHWLFWHHSAERSPEIVAAFCKNLPRTKFLSMKQRKDDNKKFPLPEIPRPSTVNKVTHTAAIVHDAVTGCLPLHYAVMQGASTEAVQVLLKAYPLSKHLVDRFGRTALHWYLGAAYLNDSRAKHVSGDTLKTAEETPWWDQRLSEKLIELLVNSRVARTADSLGRYPLHWACELLATNYQLSSDPGHVLSLDSVQLLLDHHIGQLSCRDIDHATPAMVLFDTVSKLQETAWNQVSEEQRHNKLDPIKGGPTGFAPPLALVEMIMTYPDPTVEDDVFCTEDHAGRLPIHAALEVAASTEVVEFLIQAFPPGLLHTSEDGFFVPLHAAFFREWTAPLQQPATIDLLLRSHLADDRHETYIDGRLAMKMEDSAGCFPIHYAAENDACFEIIQMLIARYPQAALQQNSCGDLAVHCLVTGNLLSFCTNAEGRTVDPNNDDRISLSSSIDRETKDAGKQEGDTSTSTSAIVTSQRILQERLPVIRKKMDCLLRPLLSEETKSKLSVAGSKHGMLPLHIAVLFRTARYPTLFRMLELNPSSAVQFMTDPVHNHRPIDLHEFCREKWEDPIEEWHQIRELLFSFGPTLESHRHRQELLERCVNIVITEINNSGESAHLKSSFQLEKLSPRVKISHSLSAVDCSLSARRMVSNTQQTQLSLKKGGNKNAVRRASYVRESKHSNRQAAAAAANNDGSRARGIDRNTKSIYDEESTSYYDASFSKSYDASDQSDDDSYFSEEGSDEDFNSAGSSDDDEEEESTIFSGTIHSGTIHSGTIHSGTIHSGTIHSGTIHSGTIHSGTVGDTTQDDTRSFDDTLGDGSLSHTFETRATFERFGTGASKTLSNDNMKSKPDPILLASASKSLDAFDMAKQKFNEEEKKDEDLSPMDSIVLDVLSVETGPKAPHVINSKDSHQLSKQQEPSFLSEVALRIWSFFTLYCDLNNPGDNYADQVADILSEIGHDNVERLISIQLPPYASQYLPKSITDLSGLSFQDIASPKCRELIHKTYYFVGKYEFNGDNDDRFVHQIINRTGTMDTSIVVRASEWLFQTEKKTSAGRNPGISEETIWASGEIPANVGVTFRSEKKAVWLKFTKDTEVYENEVNCHIGLEIPTDDSSENSVSNNGPVQPILGHYNALDTERKADRDYKMDINDARFSDLNLSQTLGTSIRLSDYPHALAYPIPSYTLSDFCFAHRREDKATKMTQICNQIATALGEMHNKGILHGNVAIENIAAFRSDNEAESIPKWLLLDLSFGIRLSAHAKVPHLCKISAKGFAQFSTGTLPPELFTKLSPKGTKQYIRYWKAVEEMFKVKVDKSVSEPLVDLETGESYAVKCYFDPSGTTIEQLPCSEGQKLPSLPYDLIEATESADIWAFGQVIFDLYAGRPLFPVDSGSGTLLGFQGICNWDSDTAEAMVCQHIADPLVQDLLLSLLSPFQTRKTKTMDAILKHPFFAPDKLSDAVRSIISSRKSKTESHKKHLQYKYQAISEKKWLEKRSISIDCWDFDFLERIHLSPTALVRGMTGQDKSSDDFTPCNFVLLPYKLCRNKSSLLTPPTRTGVEQAESMGTNLLKLSKACQLACAMQQAIAAVLENNGDSYNSLRFKSSAIFEALSLPKGFEDVKSEMMEFAASHVEAFCSDPMPIVMKLVQKRIRPLLSSFKDSETALLYPIDEVNGIPVVDDSFPVEIPQNMRVEVFESGIIFMHLSVLYARGISKGPSGLVKLIFEAAHPHVPPSWSEATRGLKHGLDEVAFASELEILQAALSDLFGTKKHKIVDNLNFMKDFLLKVDPERRCMANMSRIVASGACIWTTKEGANKISESMKQITFKDTLRSRKKNKEPTQS